MKWLQLLTAYKTYLSKNMYMPFRALLTGWHFHAPFTCPINMDIIVDNYEVTLQVYSLPTVGTIDRDLTPCFSSAGAQLG